MSGHVFIAEIPLQTVVDDGVSAAGVVYIGESNSNTAATSDAAWRIRKTYTDGGGLIVTKFADKGEFDQIFDNRVALF